MKKLYVLLVCLLALVGSASAQKARYLGYDRLPKDASSHKVVYTDVVQAPGATDAELFTRASEWLARNIYDSRVANKVEDKAAGTLVAKTGIEQPSIGALGTPNVYRFTLSIYAKDGRFKYIIEDISRSYSGITVPVEQYGKVRQGQAVDAQIEDFNNRMMAYIHSLEKAMQNTARTDF